MAAKRFVCGIQDRLNVGSEDSGVVVLQIQTRGPRGWTEQFEFELNHDQLATLIALSPRLLECSPACRDEKVHAGLRLIRSASLATAPPTPR